jgi:hypothetical protein
MVRVSGTTRAGLKNLLIVGQGGIGGMSRKFSFSPLALRAFGALLKKRTFLSNNIVDNHRTLRIG